MKSTGGFVLPLAATMALTMIGVALVPYLFAFAFTETHRIPANQPTFLEARTNATSLASTPQGQDTNPVMKHQQAPSFHAFNNADPTLKKSMRIGVDVRTGDIVQVSNSPPANDRKDWEQPPSQRAQ